MNNVVNMTVVSIIYYRVQDVIFTDQSEVHLGFQFVLLFYV